MGAIYLGKVQDRPRFAAGRVRTRPQISYRLSGTAQAVRCRKTGGLASNGTHFAGEWFEFVVEVAKTSLDSSAKQGTLASPTTKVSNIGLKPLRRHGVFVVRPAKFSNGDESRSIAQVLFESMPRATQ